MPKSCMRIVRVAAACVTTMAMIAGCGGAGGGGADVPQAVKRKLRSLAQTLHTVWVCKGLTYPPDCEQLETSVIGGLALSEYKVTRPGTLLFDVAKRRSEMYEDADAGNFCSANPVFNGRGAAFTTGFSKTIVFETQLGDGYSRQSADMEFADLRTPDGLALPKFGFILNQQRGQSIVSLQFRPSIDANLAGIAGLADDVVLSVDMATGAITEANFVGLSQPLKNLLSAVAANLPQLYDAATEEERRPGNLLPLWSKADIRAMAVQFSQASALLSQPAFAPVLTLTCDDSSCIEGFEANKFREYLIRYGSHYLQSGDPAVAAGLLGNLRAWAAAGALTTYPGFVVGQPGQNDWRPKYEMLYLLTSMIKTWAMLRPDPQVSTADRALIDNWFETLVGFATEPAGGPEGEIDPFNVGYLSRAVEMAWGAVLGDDERFARGVQRFYAGLHQMRADGSFPREVSRGACSLRYQDTMLLHLVFMAEVAAEQGYDLYSLEVDGKSLHTAIGFMLNALDDQQVVLGYASEAPDNCNVGPAILPLDLDGVTTAPLGYTYSAWLEPYKTRFPNHANAARLSGIHVGGLGRNRPLFHPHSGGNATCFAVGSKPHLPARKLDCLFDWAAANYGSYLPGPASASSSFGPYFFRQYAGGSSYLGVSGRDEGVYYLDATGMLNLGPVTGWLATSSCR